MSWRGTTTVSDRIFASLPYLLALFYGLPFGRFLPEIFAPLGLILGPLLFPIALISGLVPFAGIIIFFALLLLVVRNESISHFIRFNTMQALLISIVLFLCQLLIGILGNVGGDFMIRVLSNAIFLGVLAAFGYSVVQCFRGRYAEIPTLSEAVYMQVR